VPRDGAETVTLVDQEKAKLRLAKLHCFLQHDVEYRREVAGRGVDDFEDLSRCGEGNAALTGPMSLARSTISEPSTALIIWPAHH
jgi:hypothetical protein